MKTRGKTQRRVVEDDISSDQSIDGRSETEEEHEGQVVVPTSDERTLVALLARMERLEEENRRFREEREELSVAGRSHTSGGSGVEMVQMLQALHNKTPVLKNLERTSIFAFYVDYKRYKARCPKHVVETPQAFIVADDLEVIGATHGEDLEYIIALSEFKFFKAICEIHEVSTPVEWRQRVKQVSMDGEDLSLSALQTYNEKFQFEVMCAGTKCQIRGKEIAKIYVNGLRLFFFFRTVIS